MSAPKTGSSSPRKTSGTVLVRRPRPSDAPEFIARMRASRSFHAGRAAPPTTPAAFRAFLQRARDPRFEASLVCRESDGAIVGVINLSQIERHDYQNAHLGYYVVAEFSRHGYMTQGLALALKHGFTTLRLHRIEANIMPSNKPSRDLVERCGLLREGLSPRMVRVHGRWRDHERWAITIEDWRVRSRR